MAESVASIAIGPPGLCCVACLFVLFCFVLFFCFSVQATKHHMYMYKSTNLGVAIPLKD